VRPNSPFNTAAFRVALANAVAVSLVALLSFAGLYWVSSRHVLAQMDSEIEGDRQTLLSAYEDGGLSGLKAALDRRTEGARSRHALYLLLGTDGHKVAGNLPAIAVPAGWGWIALPSEATDPEDIPVRAYGDVLPDGGKLLVGRDPQRLDDLKEMFVSGFLWAEVGILLLGVATGYLASRRVVHGVRIIAEAADRIGAGELNRRIPEIKRGGEIARIGSAVNLMLDRIGALTDSLRQVTDDIAHDLRTPLFRLRQDLEHASLKAGSVEQLRTAVDRALAETDAIIATFNALLRIAQIEGQAQRSGFAEVDLSELLLRLVDVYAPSAEEAGKQIHAAISPHIHVLGDRDLLGQMIANLIENALRHTPRGSNIKIVLANSPSGPRLIIQDDGPGIPAGDRDRVLGRFVRLEASRGTPGTGLGLALVKAVADLHGMALQLEDARPGLRIVLHLSRTGTARSAI
jgi:signal transduction histidine kinase